MRIKSIYFKHENVHYYYALGWYADRAFLSACAREMGMTYQEAKAEMFSPRRGWFVWRPNDDPDGPPRLLHEIVGCPEAFKATVLNR